MKDKKLTDLFTAKRSGKSSTKKEVVMGWKSKCRACGEWIYGASKEQIQKKHQEHIAKGCKVVATLKRWETEGIGDEMLAMCRLDALEKELRKLIKKHSLEDVQNTLEVIESE